MGAVKDYYQRCADIIVEVANSVIADTRYESSWQIVFEMFLDYPNPPSGKRGPILWDEDELADHWNNMLAFIDVDELERLNRVLD